MATFVNLTPHVLKIIRKDGSFIEIPSDGEVRVRSEKTVVKNINGIEVFAEELKGIIGLPPEKEGIILIVSRLVAAKVAGTRSDIMVPGDLIRDEAGRVIGARGLAVL